METKIILNRHYIDDETVKVNFNILGKRYLLVLHHGDILHAEIWHSHNKRKDLVKEHYTAKDIGRGNFIKD